MPVEGEQRVNKRDPSRVAVFTNGVWVEQTGPKSRDDWGPGAVELPDGKIVRYGPKGGATVLSKGDRAGVEGEAPDLKEFEINAAGRATLMDSGLRSYNKALTEGYNPAAPRNVLARFVEDAPIPGGNFLSDVIRDKPSERARAAELQFVDGALRTTSGANAPEPEQVRANRSYFRQPGENPTVEPERAALRDRFRQTSIRAAGPAYVPAPEGFGTLEEPFDLSKGQSRKNIPVDAYYYDQQRNKRQNKNFDRGNPIVEAAPGSRPTRPAAGPKVGEIKQGYRFKGGDPASPQSWEKAQ